MSIRLFVGTKRGLFIFTSDASRTRWTASQPLLAGREIYFVQPQQNGVVWATSEHKVWGPHIHRSGDFGENWDVLPSAPHYDDQRGLHAVWSLVEVPGQPRTLFAGIEPAGLFRSADAGASWQSVDSLNRHPTAETWQPAGGALALHSIAIDAREPARMVCAVSAGGFYYSTDAAATWHASNEGVRAEFLPQSNPLAGQCVHKVIVHPADPDRIYQQNHCGVYRSDDFGRNWLEITNGLPSEFGYALAVDPHDPDVAFVVPEASSHMRATIDGKLRVYRTTDAGRSWTPLTHGLPQENAYLSILREGLCSDTLEPCGLYLGTSSGHLFASNDCGDSWNLIAGFLPRIICVAALAT